MGQENSKAEQESLKVALETPKISYRNGNENVAARKIFNYMISYSELNENPLDLKRFDGTLWVDNKQVTIKHLKACENLIYLQEDNQDYKTNKIMINSYPLYNPELENFFSCFNENSKFIDPFFNPLNELDDSWSLVRAGDKILSNNELIEHFEDKNILVRSAGSNKPFSFKLINDTDETWSLIWIDFNGQKVPYANLYKNEIHSQESFTDHVWIIKSTSGKIKSFRLSQDLFLTTNCVVNISDIFEIPKNFSSANGATFKFKIKNDLNESLKLYWIDYNGNKKVDAKLEINSTCSSQSFENHAFILKGSSDKLIKFVLTRYPFLTTGCTVNVSDIFEVPTGFKTEKSEFSDFKFSLKNDSNEKFKVYWVDYNGSPLFYFDSEIGSLKSQSSSDNHAWLLRSSSDEILIFRLCEEPFLNSDSIVNISEIKSLSKKNLIREKKQLKCDNSNKVFDFTNGLQEYSAHQGRIGNCWMLQCLISIWARYPKYIISCFIYPEKMNSTGAVAISLWSKEGKCWRLVIIDDFLPVNGKNKL
jgi:hypothetical protein